MKFVLIFFFSFIWSLFAQRPWKLFDSIKPEHYNLRMLTLMKELRFEGTVDIVLKCYEETEAIVLHAAEMMIFDDKMSVEDEQTAKEQKITSIEIDEQYEFLKINLQESLLKNQKYILHIEFEGQLQAQFPQGFYINYYLDEQKTMHYICNTHFEPTWARYAFPCFDLPHMKATFEITIGRNEKLISLSNMPLSKSEPIQERDGFFWDHFEKTFPMSTYIVAFAVLDDGMKHASCGKITYWYPPASQWPIDFSLKTTTKVLQFLEQYFGVPYELPKLDFLIVTNYSLFAGACENWGLIIAREEAYIMDMSYTGEIVTLLIAHELVHQWIGNTITMKCFGEVWLKEGLTSYVATIAKDDAIEGQTIDIDTASAFINVMTDYLSDELSPDYCPERLKDIFFFYKPSTYAKGGLIARMLVMSLGMKDFRKTMNLLLTKHRFGNIDENDIWVASKETTPSGNFPPHLQMDVVWTSWTKQEGFPLVEVTRNYNTATATLTQRKFYTVDGKNKDTCWWIPLSYTTKHGRKTNNTVAESWMSCPNEPLVITGLNSSDWILTNLHSMGLFIVKYDDHNWKLLSETLRDEKSFKLIPYWSRFRLVLDSFFLNDQGLLPHESLLSTLLYLQHEPRHIVWMAALKYLNKFNWLGEEVVRLKNEYMKILLKYMFSKKLFDWKKSSLEERKFHKEIIHQACYAGVEGCIEECFRLFQDFKKVFPNESSMDKDIRAEVLCIAVKFGPEENKKFLSKIIFQAVDRILLVQISYGLSCSMIEKIEQPIGRQDVNLEIFEQFYYPLIAKQPVLSEVLAIMYIGNSNFHQPSDLIYFKIILEKLGLNNSRSANKILRNIEENIEWRKQNSKAIKTALLKILGSSENTEQTLTTPDLKRSSKSCRFPNIMSLLIFAWMCILFFE